ncbi:MAG TPA: hypothetical protein VFW65_22130 [Pseudonocardiaceae bacterium]|nr:hypothetical protein [Pseudonocardiaceae bacterium]
MLHSITLMPTMLIAGVGVLLSVATVWRAGVRRARAAADAARSGGRLVSLAGRVLLTACLLVGVQWVVITHPGNQWLTFAVLVSPDLLAAHVLVRTLTVTTVDVRAARGRRGRRGGLR